MQKWLLINPRPSGLQILGKYNKILVPFAPMGLAYVASALEAQGARVRIHDEFAPGIPPLKEVLARFSPDVVGIGCLTPTAGALPGLVREIRSALPDVKIVLGNIHATIFHKELLQDGLADFVVRGEGEAVVGELYQALEGERDLSTVDGLSYSSQGQAAVNPDASPVKDLDSLPLPAWHLLDLKAYIFPLLFPSGKPMLPLLATRGCPFRCYFCAQNIMSPKMRTRSFEKVADEIQSIYRATGIDQYWFTDAIFPLTPEHAKEFCDAMTRRGLDKKIRWMAETRVDMVDRPMMRRMKKAGLHCILYGIETADQAMQDQYKPGVTRERCDQAIAAAKEEGVLTMGLFMLGLPGDTRRAMETTIEYAKNSGLDFAKFARAVPYPGSAFFRDVFHKRPIPAWDTFSSGYEPVDGQEDGVYAPDGLDTRELIRLHRKALFSFYVRPGLILRHLVNRNIRPGYMARGGVLLVINRLQTGLSGAWKKLFNPGPPSGSKQ